MLAMPSKTRRKSSSILSKYPIYKVPFPLEGEGKEAHSALFLGCPYSHASLSIAIDLPPPPLVPPTFFFLEKSSQLTV